MAVELRSERKLIGHISILPVAPKEFLTYELGYIFNPAYRHRGYATEAARAAVGYCFAELGAHRIVGNCNPVNEASWKVLERCGMRREGTLRQNFRKEGPSGPWTDTYVYAMLASDPRTGN